jgi:hypothetical protein
LSHRVLEGNLSVDDRGQVVILNIIMSRVSAFQI